MSIRHKLRTLFFILILLSATGGIYAYLIQQKASHYIQSKEKVFNVLVYLEEARDLEKNFLLNGRKEVDFLEDGDS